MGRWKHTAAVTTGGKRRHHAEGTLRSIALTYVYCGGKLKWHLYFRTKLKLNPF
jgi:hypothetical protein